MTGSFLKFKRRYHLSSRPFEYLNIEKVDFKARWSVESVHTKNIVSILHLLVALARHFRAPIRLPENVVVDVVIVTTRAGATRASTCWGRGDRDHLSRSDPRQHMLGTR